MEKQYYHIYLSGKISGLPDLGYSAFANAENELLKSNTLLEQLNIKKELVVINPHHLPDDHDKSWASYMRECLKALCGCDAVVVLPNWINSKGAIVEVLVAKLLNIPVYDVDTLNKIDPDYKWLLITLLTLIEK